jgi:hypothetical protein
MKSPPRLSPTLGGIAAVVFCCVVLTSGAASAQVNWKRVGTVTTLTSGQLCKTDGTNVICDSTTPSISASNFVGIGSTSPVVSLDDSQNPDAIALPGGSNAQRPTGSALVNGEIRYNNTGSGAVEAYYNGAWNSLVTSATLGTSTPAAGSTGQVQFNSGGYLGASSNLFWNNSSGYLGIGTASPDQSLVIAGSVGSVKVTSAGNEIDFTRPGVNNIAATSSSGDLAFYVNSSGSASLFINSTGKVGIGNGIAAPTNMLDVKGALSVGSGYAGTNTAPSNGMIVQGNVGIGTTSPAGTLDVEGGTASSGSGTSVKVYAQNGQASGNTNGGNIVLMPGTANGTGTVGAVGIGSASPATGVKADIAGPVKVAGTGSEPCTASQVGAIRYNPTGNYFELCSYP